MAIISIVMIAAFAVIYGMTYTNVQNENHIKLQELSTGPMVEERQVIVTETADGTQIISAVMPADYSLSFTVAVNPMGELIGIHSFLDMPEEMYESAAKLALSARGDSNTIVLNEKQWLFQIIELEDITFRQETSDAMAIVVQNCSQISFLDITDSQHMLTQLFITFGIIGFPMLFVIFGISVFFAKRAVGPVELAYLKQQQFIADASHELKTPIASIGANADALLANKGSTVESQEKWVNYIRAETDRMGKLVGDLLYLAKTEDAAMSLERLPFHVSDAVCNGVLSMEAVAYEKGLRLTQQIEPDIVIQGDCDRLSQVVKILLDNAIKYANEGGHIAIELKQTKHHVVFSITNTGVGIGEEHLSRLFDRFYRVDPSRAHDGSYGLGLSIAKAIVENMGGKIYATSVPGQSATFEFVLNK